jgi:hypothetical protein
MASPLSRGKDPGLILRLLAIMPAPVLVVSSFVLLETVESQRLLDLRFWLWVAYFAILTGWAILIGYVYSEQGPKSILIDGTNRMSLSLVQFGLWSLLLLSTIPLALLMNLIVGIENPWSIDIPNELLIASGVSLATLITAGFVEKHGEETPPDPNLVPGDGQAAAAAANAAPVDGGTDGTAVADDGTTTPAAPATTKAGNAEWDHKGVMLTRPDPQKASFADLIMGAAVNGTSRVDLVRVQMLVLTLTLVGTYLVQVWTRIEDVTVASGEETAVGFTFPGMSTELIALLALSSVGYIGGKRLDIYMSAERSRQN